MPLFNYDENFIYTHVIDNNIVKDPLVLKRFKYSGWIANRTLYEKAAWMPVFLALHSGIVVGSSIDSRSIYFLERNDKGINLKEHTHFCDNGVVTIFKPTTICTDDLLKNIQTNLEKELLTNYNLISNNCHTFTSRFTTLNGMGFTDPLNIIVLTGCILSIPYIIKKLMNSL